MLNKSCKRAVVCMLKVYGIFIFTVFVLSSLSRTLSLTSQRKASWMDRDLHHRITPKSHKNLVKEKKVYSLNGHVKPSVRQYFEDRSGAVTAEDVLNTVDFDHPSELTSRVIPSYNFLPDTQVSMRGPIRILSWTIKYFRPPGPWYPEGREAFENCELEPWMKCEYTHDRNYLNFSEALLFHPQRIFDLPRYRFSNQKWIFWEMESPQHTWQENQNLHKFSHMFNLTSTYSLDSTVPIPYAHTCSSKPSKKKRKEHPNYAKGKRGRVAWLAFTCHSCSRREAFVRELQRYIPVDVYGFCGPMSCQKHLGDDCLKKVIEKKYKFYLSMDESFCKHLLSQNIWKIYNLRLNMIPIVLGAANYSDYYPDRTFIDVRNFDSVQRLARYLQFLDKSDEHYNQYIINRGQMTCGFTTNYNNYLCQLCRHLHNYRRHREHIADISKYWNAKERCQEPDDFYEQHFKKSTSPWWKH